ncbi:type II and III secretion system protein family protein [Chelativorans sp. AA-79]|uniref:type II and III secretion system protein family protein n=1 Tax=Chelativorans sp. AA-79 TaxID=3028735 RepID=UPI0023F7FB96|nr:type II and III secretion system protein family protein [Chelativorans sp. AA-79]WEX09334.1 type II and III secretion system protein family protein [Chelativorans sp. AA-79]
MTSRRAAEIRRNGALLLAALVLAVPGQALLPPAAHAEDIVRVGGTGSQRLKLGLNKSLVIDLPTDAYDILVANPAVADAVTRTARRIYLFGKQVGETNIFVFGAGGEQIASIDVAVERDVAGLEKYLERFIPNSEIDVELINDNVVLTGTVETPLDASRAAQLATIFVTGGEATTGQYSQTAAAPTDGGGVAISNPDFFGRQQSKIVNMLQIIGEDQVTLKVTVAEVSRSVMKQLGVNMIGSGNVDGISWGAILDNPSGLGVPASASQLSLGGSLLQGYLNAMEQAGVMKTLSEPTLTAISGEKATFKVGGEFNLATSQKIEQGDATKGQSDQIVYEVEKIEYGIGLEFTPTVLSPGRISLKVRTSVSEPTFEGSVSLGAPSIGGRYNVPGMNALSIRKRLADTTVELPSGGSMMIAGLVRDDVRQTINGLPGLSKIPVLGALFRSRGFVRNETELVVIITPYLARPVARTALAKPDDNFNPASEGAGIFLGRVNRVYGTMKTSLPNGRYHGVVGYIYK